MTLPADAILLFDLGGVVVPWVGFESIAAMTGLDREVIDHGFEAEAAVRDYELGHIPDAAFCEALPRVFGLDVAPADVPALWKSWVRAPFPGVVEAITQLKATHRTACLSNTNALHWAHIQTMFDMDALFDVPLASHILHAAKPQARIYQLALDALGNPDPARVHFFEDTTRNLEAAEAAGFTVHPVDRSVGVLPVLERLGLVG